MPAVLDPILHDEAFDTAAADAPRPAARPAASARPLGRRRRRPRAATVVCALLAVAAAGVAVPAVRGRGVKTRLLALLSMGDRVALIQPSLITSRPLNGAAQVLPGTASITAKLYLPNGAIDPATLNASTVRLVRASDGAALDARLSISDGQILHIRPAAPLDPTTRYTVELTAGIRDAGGAAMTPASFGFTTGEPAADPAIRFAQVPLPTTAGVGYTCVQVGPDGHLWAGGDDGRIFRFPVLPGGALGPPRVITSLQLAAGGDRLLTGFCFDPAAAAGEPVVWASHGVFAFEGAPDLSGTLSRLSGPDLSRVEHVVTGLPRSVKDHLNNQPVFGPDGALYFGQGSNNSYGEADPIWGNRGQRMLSAAVLRLDVNKLAGVRLPLDVRTPDAGGAYDPAAPDAPLTIYAAGVRQAWDLVWHSNGRLYAPVNGSSAGGNTPAGPGIPALTAIPDAEHDWLLRITPGRYYGHPNRVLGHFVLNGGNPTPAADPAEVPQYPVGTRPDPAWEPPAYDFGNHVSANGIIEYRNRDAFGGKLAGWLIVCRYNSGADLLALAPDGDAGAIRTAVVGIPGFGNLVNPLDIAEDVATGNLYVSEYGAQRITLVRPVRSPAEAGAPGNAG